MLSIGELADKLVIENIKIFNLREKLHSETLSDEDYVKINHKMMVCNDNRSILANWLDEKVDKVVSGQEKNKLLKTIKTY
jgi:hypothetical protein